MEGEEDDRWITDGRMEGWKEEDRAGEERTMIKRNLKDERRGNKEEQEEREDNKGIERGEEAIHTMIC